MKPEHPAGTTAPSSNYVDASARLRFWLLCASTFLIFLSNSATALLAVIFQQAGHSDLAVGQLLAVYGLGALAGILASGFAADSLGALATARLGAALMLGSYLSYALSLHSFPMALASRLTHGFAYGLMLAPAMLLAKAQLSPRYFVTLFGVYASMIPLPNAFGPSAAAWLLGRLGMDGFFVLSAAPMALGVAGLLCMRHAPPHPTLAPHRRYRQLIRHVALQKLCAIVCIVGLMFGVVPSYMASFLIENGIPLAAFFTTFSTTMFAGRFLVAPLIEKLPHGGVVGAGILAMGLGFLALGHAPTLPHALAAGVSFGLGYSLCYPRLSAMLVASFADNEREKPIALFNMAFVAGTYAVPWLVGALHSRISLTNMLLMLGLGAASMGLAQLGCTLFRPSTAEPLVHTREPHR